MTHIFYCQTWIFDRFIRVNWPNFRQNMLLLLLMYIYLLQFPWWFIISDSESGGKNNLSKMENDLSFEILCIIRIRFDGIWCCTRYILKFAAPGFRSMKSERTGERNRDVKRVTPLTYRHWYRCWKVFRIQKFIALSYCNPLRN